MVITMEIVPGPHPRPMKMVNRTKFRQMLMGRATIVSPTAKFNAALLTFKFYLFVMDVELDQCIVKHLHEIFTVIIITTFVSITFCVLDYVTKTETCTQSRINDDVGCLILV